MLDDGWLRAAIFVIGNFPFFKQATLEALETIFATKTLGRQLALVSISALTMTAQGITSFDNQSSDVSVRIDPDKF